METDFLIEQRGFVLHGSFSRERGVNSFSQGLLAKLDAFCERIETDESIRAAIIGGSGRVFMIGSDLDQIERGLAEPLVFQRYLRAFNATMNRIANLPVPTVAAINGMTRAGGLEVVLACDHAIIAEEAQIGDGHSAQFAIPAGGSTQRLPRRIGVPRAKELIWSGRFLDAREAVEWGLCDRAVPAAEVIGAAEALLATFTDKPRPCLSEIKSLILRSQTMPLHDGVELELQAFLSYVRAHPFVSDGIAAFRERQQSA
ncbi:MAG: enoyl-CoA hydratase/isomerase family protein [Sphingomicrobium sp.]